MKYVSLLRGVNVGGKNKVSMSELKKVYESLGFQAISTYINSGNVIFESESLPDDRQISAKIETVFGFPVSVLTVEGKKIIAIAEKIPDDWMNDTPNPEKTGQKSDVIYLFDEANSSDILAKIGYRPEWETIVHVDGALLSNISRRNQSKSALLKLIASPLYQYVTIRNSKTAKKLAELVR